MLIQTGTRQGRPQQPCPATLRGGISPFQAMILLDTSSTHVATPHVHTEAHATPSTQGSQTSRPGKLLSAFLQSLRTSETRMDLCRKIAPRSARINGSPQPACLVKENEYFRNSSCGAQRRRNSITAFNLASKTQARGVKHLSLWVRKT